MTNLNTIKTSPVTADRLAGASESWRRLDDVATVGIFAFSGNATITLVNNQPKVTRDNPTGKPTRVTVRFTGTKLADGGRSTTEFAVRALVARRNGDDVYAEIGILSRPEHGQPKLDTRRRTTDNRRRRRYIRDRARWREAQTATRTVEWLLGKIDGGVELPDHVEVFNAGRCRCCGKALRVPSYSNKRDEIVAGVVVGLGPVCANEASTADSVPVRDGANMTTAEPVVDRAVFAAQVDEESPFGFDLVEVQTAEPKSGVAALLALLNDVSTTTDW